LGEHPYFEAFGSEAGSGRNLIWFGGDQVMFYVERAKKLGERPGGAHIEKPYSGLGISQKGREGGKRAGVTTLPVQIIRGAKDVVELHELLQRHHTALMRLE
jgi:hypothetical protein